MSERDAFLRAIAAEPSDDTVRLAFADWLDEHDEPERAEFIRLQIERERAKPFGDASAPTKREKALLDAHLAEWLGPLADLDEYSGFGPTFRRGFVESAMVHGRILADRGA